MASLLTTRFREMVSKSKDPRMKNEAVADVAYPSGFTSFDFLNGTIVHVKSYESSYDYYAIGIRDGSFIMLIGRSHCGKTTFGLQLADAITRPFPNSAIYIDDMEHGATDYRIADLFGQSIEIIRNRIIRRDSGITAENLYERLKWIHDEKLSHYDDYVYDTGFYDEGGNKILKLQPTVYLVDSIAMLMPEKYAEEDELSGSMSATAAAKTNSAVFKRIMQMLKDANIILIGINHITQSIDINPMQRKRAKLAYLKQDEALPGGNTIIYLADNIIRLDDVTKLKEADTFGFSGSIVDVTLCKSRSNRSGQVTTLVLNQLTGFDQELSLFQYLKDNKLVNGAGAYLYIGDDKDNKFSQKTFKEKLHSDPAFRKNFYTVAINHLKEVAQKYDMEKTRSIDVGYDIMSEINGIINSQNVNYSNDYNVMNALKDILEKTKL